MWPNYIALALPGLPWITMARITGVPLGLILLICVSTSREFRESVSKALASVPLLSILLVTFVGIQTVSIAFSKTVFTSIDKYLVDQLGWTCIFFVSVYVFQKEGRVERMAGLLWAMAIFVGVIAVFEYRQEKVLWAGHIPSFLQINDKSVARTLAGGDRFGRYRANSTFGTCLGLGEYMALSLPFVLRFAMGSYPHGCCERPGLVLGPLFRRWSFPCSAAPGWAPSGCLVALMCSTGRLVAIEVAAGTLSSLKFGPALCCRAYLQWPP